MPLRWDDVEPGLEPRRFTLRTAPAAIAASGAWDDYAAGARPLREAIGRLK
jgi:bifunctional non-homologous end joining protein LigD